MIKKELLNQNVLVLEQKMKKTLQIAEEGRQRAEQARLQAEKDKQQAEEGRQLAEQARLQAEQDNQLLIEQIAEQNAMLEQVQNDCIYLDIKYKQYFNIAQNRKDVIQKLQASVDKIVNPYSLCPKCNTSPLRCGECGERLDI